MSEPQRFVREEPEGDQRQETGPDHETVEALSGALGEIREIGRDLLELSRLQFERARIGVRSGVFNVGVAGWLYTAAIATSVLAVYFLIDGVAGGLAVWLGAAWAGRAIAGALVLGVMGLVVLGLRLKDRRANLRRLQRKFEPEDGHGGTP